MYATSARSTEEAHRQGALHITLLQDPLDLTEKYNIEGTETQGHRAARRNEQLLQLFLYLHVLAAEQPGRSPSRHGRACIAATDAMHFSYV